MIIRSNATARPDLKAAVIEHQGQESDFIGTMVMPVFDTEKQAGTFPKVTRESIMRTGDTKRAPRSAYNRDGYEVEEGSFKCEENGHEQPIDDGERALYKEQFDADLVAVKIATNRVLMNQEIRIKTLLQNTSTFTGTDLYTDESGSSPWDTAASDVLLDVRNAKAKVKANSGVRPNALILSEQAREWLKSNTGIKDSIKYVKELTDEELNKALAGLFGLEYVLVGGSMYNSAKEGQDFSGSYIWSSLYAMVCRIATDAADLSQPSIGRTFNWVSDAPNNVLVEQYREENIRSEVFRVRQYTDEVVIDPYFGHLMKIDS